MDASFIQRTRQRKVVQWGLAYLAAAWVLAQVFHLVGQQFDWPAPVLRAVTVLLAYGALPALVVAWYHGEKGAQHVTRKEAALLVALVAVGGGLAWWITRPAPGEPVELAIAGAYSPTRIAVLPFEDFSPGRDQQFLGDGIADTLLRTFAGIEELSVIARASAFAYRGRDVATIARDLEVGSVLEGSVQRAGDRLRIVAQLVRTADQSQVWSLSFERPAGDIFAIQDEIAAQVVEALLGAEVLGVERPPLARTSTEAYDLYLQGRELWQTREPESIRRAVEMLETVLELDPAYGAAHSELATAMHLLPAPPGVTPTEWRARVQGEISRALGLDPGDAQAYAVRGLQHLSISKLADARQSLEHALSLRPNDVNILGWLGLAYHSAGLADLAAEYYRRAFALDPMNLYARTRLVDQLGTSLSDEAVPLARQTVRLFPESSHAWLWLTETYMREGDARGAVLAAVDALDHVRRPDPFVYRIAAAMNLLAEHALADRWRTRIPDFDPGWVADFQWHVTRQQLDVALSAISNAIDRFGSNPAALVWLGRGLMAAERYDEARDLFERLMAAGPDLSEPANVSWVHLDPPVNLAGLARLRGDDARAVELDAIARRVIADKAAHWPQGEAQMMFLLDSMMGRYDDAAGRLDDAHFRNLDAAYLITNVSLFAPLRETDAGRTYLQRMARERQRQVQQLREAGIPWLFEPDLWRPKAGAGS